MFVVEARTVSFAKNIQLLLIWINVNTVRISLVTVHLDEEIVFKDKTNVHYQAEHSVTS